MKALLDTHALIWALSAPAKLPMKVLRVLKDDAAVVYFSPINTWEIVIKSELHKITLPLTRLTAAIEAALFVELPFQHRHAMRLKALPLHHRDPFDRALIAQALSEDLLVVTKDPAFEKYRVSRLWD